MVPWFEFKAIIKKLVKIQHNEPKSFRCSYFLLINTGYGAPALDPGTGCYNLKKTTMPQLEQKTDL